MLKPTRIIWIIMLVLVLILLGGCSTGIADGEDNQVGYTYDLIIESPRGFAISDKDIYPGKKQDCNVLDKQPNFNYSIYIYVLNPGEIWTQNEIEDIIVTYHDITRGMSIEYTPTFPLLYDNKTYIRVDNISYPYEARGYFRVEGMINQGVWYSRSVNSNIFNYAEPNSNSPLPPINKGYFLYEKEYVD